MIKPAFIKAQILKTQSQERVSPFLRRLVGSVVDRAAREHYGANYCMRRQHVSLAVSTCLLRVGVLSNVWLGAFCAPQFSLDTEEAGWGGFWDQHCHAWVTTQFGEIVDLTVAQITHLPTAKVPNSIPLPPIWWNDGTQTPTIIRYLPDTSIGTFTGTSHEISDLEMFLLAVERIWFETLAASSVDEVRFERFLEDTVSMQRFSDTGHPWFERAIVVQDLEIPLPKWICDREDELDLAARRGVRAPTRLPASIG